MQLTHELWFENPRGLVFKITVSVNNGSSDELLELARASWDGNKAAGFTPKSVRP